VNSRCANVAAFSSSDGPSKILDPILVPIDQLLLGRGLGLGLGDGYPMRRFRLGARMSRIPAWFGDEHKKNGHAIDEALLKLPWDNCSCASVGSYRAAEKASWMRQFGTR
jgi:hypothetical protein